jgi:hypothetical protein
VRNVIALPLALAASLIAPVSWADCPVSVLWACGSDAGVPATLPGATIESDVEPWSVGQPCAQGCYDIVHGSLEARGAGNGFGPGCGTGAWMTDDYWVEGPSSGQPLSFEVLLSAEVAITGTYGVSGGLLPSGSGFFTTSSGPQTVVAALTKSVGEVFSLQANLETSGSGTEAGSAHAIGTLRFRGLPAGYAVVSCQGYALATPAIPGSWGGLKGRYR